MGRGRGGSGRGSRSRGTGGGLNNPNLTASQRFQLEQRRSDNVEADRRLYQEARTAPPERRREIQLERQRLANERLALDYGTARANQLINRA